MDLGCTVLREKASCHGSPYGHLGFKANVVDLSGQACTPIARPKGCIDHQYHVVIRFPLSFGH